MAIPWPHSPEPLYIKKVTVDVRCYRETLPGAPVPVSGEYRDRAEKHSTHSLSPAGQPAMFMGGECSSVVFVTVSNMHGQAKIF